jgi:sarcosine oxidase subunit gamma
LPLAANTFTAGSHRVYWLGPDEWLAVTTAAEAPGLVRSLESALAGRSFAVNDLSGGNVVLGLAGRKARDVLARGCTLDLHPDVFPVGAAAQTGLAKAGVLLGLVDDAPVFEIVVRRSFADYLCRWLAHVARHGGVAFES